MSVLRGALLMKECNFQQAELPADVTVYSSLLTTSRRNVSRVFFPRKRMFKGSLVESVLISRDRMSTLISEKKIPETPGGRNIFL